MSDVERMAGLIEYAAEECVSLRAEVAELREQLAGQKAINLRLAERLRACSERDTVQGHTEGGR